MSAFVPLEWGRGVFCVKGTFAPEAEGLVLNDGTGKEGGDRNE